MIIQLKHKDYTAQQTKVSQGWVPIDNRTDGNGYVVIITPTSSNSNVLINCNCHIGINNSNDARWYGLRLYRKIGSGSWEHVTGAGGTTTGAGTECWLADNMGMETNYSYLDDALISNLGNSYLDSPNTTETVYYTIYWEAFLGDITGAENTIYLNRAHDQTGQMQSKPTSTLTAQEIWNDGTSYVPPSSSVITIDNNNVGINTTNPTYPLYIDDTKTNSADTATGNQLYSGGVGEWTGPVGPVSLYAVGGIWSADKFIASSDLRIKKIYKK